MQLPAADGEVRAAAAPPPGDPGPQHAGRGVPVLQAPERGRPLQQPADRDAACKASVITAAGSASQQNTEMGGVGEEKNRKKGKKKNTLNGSKQHELNTWFKDTEFNKA